MPVVTEAKKIDAFLTRGVENVYPSRDFVKAWLSKGERLTIYLGVDPTGPTLHLGHVIPLMKLRELQDLGHKVILLIGDFTAMIGDPTDKTATRKKQTRKEVLANAKHYKAQAGKILNFSGSNKAELKYNSQWLANMSLADLVELAAHTTVQRLEERDMFEKRREDGKPVFMHEFLYPIMQGYDSVAMSVDGEIGGNDQTFNMLVGRDFVKALKKKEKFVIATKLLTDPTGKKMGKSEGNMITLEDSAEQMFGKVMSWGDAMIVPGFEVLTRVDEAELKAIEGALKSENPRDLKMRLARAVAAFFHGEKAAAKAQEAFASTFQRHETPTDIPTLVVKKAKVNILDVLADAKLVASKGEAKRLIDGGGVKVGGHVIEGYDAEVIPSAEGVVVQKGKRHFVRVVKG
ncbi:tyrosine--tRNA ligase [Candidatus Uhrbacteria bacterium RIFCSPHIGHO2_01_FULL_63_20]|uniref:Tyrosine--tRNA ligase n=1 Tax=Candidatus Uhrbacteria bacterium RIFCSPHIGHO2_01_FULL_63_20 TaxID=1802385 RepID=A0A1F7TMU7_9BACT|nr:MAG: tyrosine--tRNA ligase [Candidatus Uhrbacteria bacterium RIFCSPHIGHO2_01_FULL_63_20]